jgi:P27 family predicted phage terminase small subunit
MPGPAAKPTTLKILEGNPGHQKLNLDEPQPEVGVPECPTELTGEARKEWGRVCAILTACRVLTMADRAALAAYCQCWSRWLQAERHVTRRGQVLSKPDKQGHRWEYPNPAVSIAHRAAEQMRRLMQELGLTPASRSRIRVEGARGEEGAVPTRDRGKGRPGGGGGGGPPHRNEGTG